LCCVVFDISLYIFIRNAASIYNLPANDTEAHSLNTYITVYRYVSH